MAKRTLRHIALAAIITATASMGIQGCSSGDDSPDAGNQVTVPSVEVLKGTKQERHLLGDAEKRLIQTCMRKQGFDYYLTAPVDDAGSKDDLPNNFGDADRASKRGYGFYKLPETTPDKDAFNENRPVDVRKLDKNERYRYYLSKDRRLKYDNAMSGEEDNDAIRVTVPGRGELTRSNKGCRSEAENTLYGNVEKWVRAQAFFGSIDGTPITNAMRDPKYPALTVKWRTCMRGKGYTYKRPEDAARAAWKLFDRLPDGKKDGPHPQEVKIAVADAECDTQVGLSKTLKELTQQQQEKFLKENEGQILAYRDMRAHALKKAKTIVKS